MATIKDIAAQVNKGLPRSVLNPPSKISKETGLPQEFQWASVDIMKAGYRVTKEMIAKREGFDSLALKLKEAGVTVPLWDHQLALIQRMKEVENKRTVALRSLRGGAENVDDVCKTKVVEIARCGQVISAPGSGKSATAIAFAALYPMPPHPLNVLSTDALQTIENHSILLPSTFFVIPTPMESHWCDQIKMCCGSGNRDKWLVVSNKLYEGVQTVTAEKFTARLQHYCSQYANILIPYITFKDMVRCPTFANYTIARIIIDESIGNMDYPKVLFLWILCATFPALYRQICNISYRGTTLYGILRQAFQKRAKECPNIYEYAVNVDPGVTTNLPPVISTQLFSDMGQVFVSDKGDCFKPDLHTQSKYVNIKFLNTQDLFVLLKRLMVSIYKENPKACILIYYYAPVHDYSALEQLFAHFHPTPETRKTNMFFMKTTAGKQIEHFKLAAKENSPCCLLLNAQNGMDAGQDISQATHMMVVGEVPKEMEQQMQGRAQRTPRTKSLHYYRILPKYTASTLNELFFNSLPQSVAAKLTSELNRAPEVAAYSGSQFFSAPKLSWSEDLATRRCDCLAIAIAARKSVKANEAYTKKTETMMKRRKDTPTFIDTFMPSSDDEEEDIAPPPKRRAMVSSKTIPKRAREDDDEEEKPAKRRPTASAVPKSAEFVLDDETENEEEEEEIEQQEQEAEEAYDINQFDGSEALLQ